MSSALDTEGTSCCCIRRTPAEPQAVVSATCDDGSIPTPRLRRHREHCSPRSLTPPSSTAALERITTMLSASRLATTRTLDRMEDRREKCRKQKNADSRGFPGRVHCQNPLSVPQWTPDEGRQARSPSRYCPCSLISASDTTHQFSAARSSNPICRGELKAQQLPTTTPARCASRDCQGEGYARRAT
jgi:hypothetical protein